ncbi:MAG: hypothetical protein K9I47_07620 [Bacteroidales bacterium]|nr:hypothetical protein [Bacteroidales bacterium]
MKKFIRILLLTSFATLMLAEVTNAIPAFARKYRMSCTTCHAPAAPSLKDFGDDFAGSGFKLEDYDSPGYYVDAGDDKLSLLRNFPVAVRLDGFATYNNGNDEKFDFGSPYLMKFLSGGALSKKVTYYFYFYFNERGEVVGVEDAYLMYDNLFGSELDIMLGQFQVSDPLFKRELRLQLEDYKLYTSQIGISQITMKYDRGVMFTYGFETGTDLTLEIVNGNGLRHAGDFHLFDQDRYKNYMGRISQNIGEYFRVGAFAYSGKEKMDNSINNTITNEMFIYGPDFTLNVDDRWVLNFQYTMRNDSEVYSSPGSLDPMKDLDTEGILAELVYSPKAENSDWYLLSMYNKVDSDFEPANYESVTFHAGYMLRRNVRLAGEYTYIMNAPQQSEYGRFSFGFVSAF